MSVDKNGFKMRLKGVARQIKCSVKPGDVDVVIAAAYFFSFLSDTGTIPALVRYVLVAYLFLKYVRTFSSVLPTFFMLVLYSFVLLGSTYVETGSVTFAVSGFMHGLLCIDVFLVFVRYVQTNGSTRLLKLLFWFYLIALIVTDASLALYPYDYKGANTIFLIGNKFTVSYCHCLLVGIAFALYRDRFVVPVLLMLVTLVVCAVVSCTTGFIMGVTMIVLFLLSERAKTVLSNPIILFSLLAVLNILVWSDIDLLHSEPIQNILTNVFGKSPNLTGRDRLYDATLGFVAERPLFGYGYLTDIYRDAFGYGNAQNGVFHIITQAGIIGAVLYFAALAVAMMGVKGDGLKRVRFFGVMAYLYALVIGSLVEINLSLGFVIGVALWTACERPSAVAPPKREVFRRDKKSSISTKASK